MNHKLTVKFFLRKRLDIDTCGERVEVEMGILHFLKDVRMFMLDYLVDFFQFVKIDCESSRNDKSRRNNHFRSKSLKLFLHCLYGI